LAVASSGGWRYQSRWVGDRRKLLGSRKSYTPLFSIGASFPTSISHLSIVDADRKKAEKTMTPEFFQTPKCFVSDCITKKVTYISIAKGCAMQLGI